MEASAILSALWLVACSDEGVEKQSAKTWREILFNGSILLLVGAFAVGWFTGLDGLAQIERFIVSPFKGVLCLFLLDMGLVAAGH